MIQQSQISKQSPHPLKVWCLWNRVGTIETPCTSELKVLVMSLLINVLVPDVILSSLPEELRGGSR